jgi:hypothetical protein
VRWAGRALVDVAELILRHGVELRQAMLARRDAMPSPSEEIADLKRDFLRTEGKLEAEQQKKKSAQAKTLGN